MPERTSNIWSIFRVIIAMLFGALLGFAFFVPARDTRYLSGTPSASALARTLDLPMLGSSGVQSHNTPLSQVPMRMVVAPTVDDLPLVELREGERMAFFFGYRQPKEAHSFLLQMEWATTQPGQRVEAVLIDTRGGTIISRIEGTVPSMSSNAERGPDDLILNTTNGKSIGYFSLGAPQMPYVRPGTFMCVVVEATSESGTMPKVRPVLKDSK
jgi:hypothetical protein